MSAFDYPDPPTDPYGEPVCATCCDCRLDEATYYHPLPEGIRRFVVGGLTTHSEPTPFCSRSCFLYWQWKQERAAL